MRRCHGANYVAIIFGLSRIRFVRIGVDGAIRYGCGNIGPPRILGTALSAPGGTSAGERVERVSSEMRSSAVGWQAQFIENTSLLVRLADDLLSQFFSAHARAET